MPSPLTDGRRRVTELVQRLSEDVSAHNLTIIAAGMAYDAIFALFPALATLVSLYGLFADPAGVSQQIASLARFVPGDVARIVGGQLNKLVTSSGSHLGVSLVISLALALYSMGSGIKAMIAGLNVAYGVKERRGYFRLWAVAMLLALVGVLVGVLVVGLGAMLPAIWSLLGLGSVAQTVISILRWPVMVLVVILGVDVLYRFAPCRPDARWRWITWGAVLCTAVWVGGSAVLSFYVSNFGKYDQTYGSLGGAFVLLLWLYFSSLTVLFGAEIDALIEQQRRTAASRESSHTVRGGQPEAF